MTAQALRRFTSIVRSLAWVTDAPWFQLISIIAAIIVVYWGLWHCYFSWDDFWLLGWVRFKPSLLDGLMTELQLGYGVRPVLDAHLWVRSQLFGLNAAPYYVVALIQHIIVSVLIYWQVILLKFDRPIAWLGALLFGTTFAANSAINWITGSNYSLVYIPGLLSICLFILFRERRDKRFLILSVLAFAMALFTGEPSVVILPLFVLYDLLVAWKQLDRRGIATGLLVHLSYWIWLVPYAVLQLTMANTGSSEYAGRLAPGTHVFGNYFYLVYLAVPNFTAAPIQGFLNRFLPTGWFELATAITWLLFMLLLFSGVYVFWRGRPAQKFLVAWIPVAFLPYALWTEGLAAADRYLYLPAGAFFTLLSCAIVHWWRRSPPIGKRLRWLAPVFVVSLLALNVAFHQIWIRQQIYNGSVRRAVVEQLLRDIPSPEPGTHFILEVPELNFLDLRHVCVLIYRQRVKCTAFVTGESPPTFSDSLWYWLRVDEYGFEIVDSQP